MGCDGMGRLGFIKRGAIHHWGSSREVPFSTDFCELAVSEMNFWLSQLVLEIYKKNGVMPKFAIKCSQSRLT